MIRRHLTPFLETWSREDGRKPLVLRGARQVGKTHLVRTWAASRFSRVVELNAERDLAVPALFADNDPRATLRRIEAFVGLTLATDGSALLFLDEVQAAPALLAKLRWFAEELPSLPILATGSLLDFALADHSFSVPVGRLSYAYLEPIGFSEFLTALGEDQLANYLATEVTPATIAAGSALPPPLHERLTRLLHEYVLVGGMPGVVARYAGERSLPPVGRLQADLLATLRDDFGKYAARVPAARLAAVLTAAAQRLGQKFRYSHVDRDARSADLRRAVELLTLARVLHRIPATPAEGVPLLAGADERRFKLLCLDVGLASSTLGLSLAALEAPGDLVLGNRGPIAEQLVGQLLRLTFAPYEDPRLAYWHREQRGSEAEVDYLLEHRGRIVPIEVKAGAAGSLKSLHQLMAERRLDLAVRLDSNPPSLTQVAVRTRTGHDARYRLLSLPLYLAEHTRRLLDAT